MSQKWRESLLNYAAALREIRDNCLPETFVWKIANDALTGNYKPKIKKIKSKGAKP